MRHGGSISFLQLPDRIWERELSFGWHRRPTSLDSVPIMAPLLSPTGWGLGTHIGVHGNIEAWVR